MSESTQQMCTIIRAQDADTYEGKQGLTYFAGISRETAGSQHLCLNVLTFQPGQKARTHLHQQHESAIYILSGSTELWYGDRLQYHEVMYAGDFVYIPAGMPHVPWNTSETEICNALIARTDPDEQESVVLLPELENLPIKRD